jgi:hypothetical protein
MGGIVFRRLEDGIDGTRPARLPRSGQGTRPVGRWRGLHCDRTVRCRSWATHGWLLLFRSMDGIPGGLVGIVGRTRGSATNRHHIRRRERLRCGLFFRWRLTMERVMKPRGDSDIQITRYAYIITRDLQGT